MLIDIALTLGVKYEAYVTLTLPANLFFISHLKKIKLCEISSYKVRLLGHSYYIISKSQYITLQTRKICCA